MTQEEFFPETLEASAGKKIRFTVYYGNIAHTPILGDLEYFINASLGVNEEGTIVFINENTTDPITEAINFNPELTKDDIEVVDISNNQNKFFFPGFIDTHIHASQFPNNGIFGNSTLLDWLETYTFPLESSFKDLKVANDIYNKAINRTLINGTTTASYYATIHASGSKLLADIALKKGQRALVGKVCMNQNSPDHYIETFDECKESTHEVIDHLNKRDPSHELLMPVITPRFAGSCTEKLMKWLGDFRAENDYHCQTHLSENKREIQWTKELFPDFNHYTDIYAKTNLLGPKTVLAHCIHLSDEERDLIRDYGSGVSHCPASNSSITSGEARIRWLLNSGINVSLGSDCSGGFDPSILSVAKHALLVSRHLVMKSEDDDEKLSVNDVLYLATMGGAKVLRLDDKIGSFAVGKKWDAQLIDLSCENSPVDTFEFQEPIWGGEDLKLSKRKYQDLIDKWLFNGDDRNVRSVFVNGRRVLSKN
ncbi:zinc ion binding protein [[Candida] boidinii]|nr:zinc ion binding protein [[Candida] boidinii]